MSIRPRARAPADLDEFEDDFDDIGESEGDRRLAEDRFENRPVGYDSRNSGIDADCDL